MPSTLDRLGYLLPPTKHFHGGAGLQNGTRTGNGRVTPEIIDRCTYIYIIQGAMYIYIHMVVYKKIYIYILLDLNLF